MIFENWSRAVVRIAAGVAVAATLLAGCGDDSGSDGDAGASPEPTDSSASALSPRSEDSTGECTPPTSDVMFASGTATLTVANGPQSGDYELTADLERPEDNAYLIGFGEHLVGNWQGDGLEDVEDLPKLEVRMLNEGNVCQGTPIVRIYLPYVAYEDNDSVACTASLDTLSTTVASGRFDCTGMARTFGSRDPEALDASGTFNLGS